MLANLQQSTSTVIPLQLYLRMEGVRENITMRIYYQYNLFEMSQVMVQKGAQVLVQFY